MSLIWLPGAVTRRGWNRPTVVHDDPPPDPGEQERYYTEDAHTDFTNPERGWYGRHWGDRTWGTRTPAHDTHTCPYGQAQNPIGLYLAVGSVPLRVSAPVGFSNLSQWRYSAIPQQFLDDLASKLASMRGTTCKAKMRFSYGSGDDSTFAWIMYHIDQLMPVISTYVDCVYSLDAGFWGRWGEWHSSSHFNSTAGDGNGLYWRQILDRILTSTPSELPIRVRYPRFIMRHFSDSVLPRERYFDGTHQARVMQYNDCLGYNWADRGTFENQAEKDYSYAIGAYATSAGETCDESLGEVNSQWSDGSYINTHMNALGWGGYLHCDFACYTLYKWWLDDTSGDFRHTDGVTRAPDGSRWLEWISRLLGYRFVLDRVLAPDTVTAGASMTLNVRMSNTGYGAMERPRPLQVVFTRTGDTQSALAEADFRTVMPLSGEQVDMALTFNAPAGLVSGETYALALHLPDNSAHWSGVPANSIRFANSGVWSSVNGWNLLSLNVSVPA